MKATLSKGFVDGEFYATRGGRKAQRVESEDVGKWLAFRIFWIGYATIEHYNQAGRYLGITFDHDLDIVGPWDDSIWPRLWVVLA